MQGTLDFREMGFRKKPNSDSLSTEALKRKNAPEGGECLRKGSQRSVLGDPHEEERLRPRQDFPVKQNGVRPWSLGHGLSTMALWVFVN